MAARVLGLVGLAGVGSGLITGGLVGITLLAVLAGVFDPPADIPVVPILALGFVSVLFFALPRHLATRDATTADTAAEPVGA